MTRTDSEVNGTQCRLTELDSVYRSSIPHSCSDIRRESGESPVPSIKCGSDSTYEELTIADRNRVVDEQLVDKISAVADIVATALKTAELSGLRGAIDEWCDLHGFDTADQCYDIVAQQAVLNLFLKTTLYEWHHQRGTLPELTPDPRKNLQQASDRTGDSAFEESVLDEVVWLVDETVLAPVVEARQVLLTSGDPPQDIARLYGAVTPNTSRRTLGQYRTPRAIERLIRGWVVSGGDTVLDPGMGAGVLSRSFHPQWKVSTDPSHVTGIDRCPLASLMGTVALTLTHQPHNPQTQDFLDLSPADVTQDIDAVVCNPPYSRHQALTSEYKNRINAQAERETGLTISLKSPLYAYFYYHIRQFLGTGDRAAVVTPHHFLTRDYGVSLKEFLLREFDVKVLLMSDPDSGSVFETAQTTELVVFLEAANADEDTGLTRFIHVTGDPDPRTLLDAVHGRNQGDTDWGSINCVRQADLDPEQKWDCLFDPIDVETSHLTPLSELAEVRRGLQTGENDFFCLSKTDVDTWGVESEYLSRMVPKPAHVDGYDIRPADWDDYATNDRPTWLLYHTNRIEGVPETTYDEEAGRAYWCEDSIAAETTCSAVEYLRHGLTDHEKLRTRKTVHNRTPWYRVERGNVAPILVAPMSRSGFRVLFNETGARHINNYYGVYPEPTIGRTGQKALLAYLNSDYVNDIVAQYQRTHADGLNKVEPGDVKDLPVIDPRALPDDVVATLAECFDDLREAARRNETEDAVIDRIDTVLQREL